MVNVDVVGAALSGSSWQGVLRKSSIGRPVIWWTASRRFGIPSLQEFHKVALGAPHFGHRNHSCPRGPHRKRDPPGKPPGSRLRPRKGSSHPRIARNFPAPIRNNFGEPSPSSREPVGTSAERHRFQVIIPPPLAGYVAFYERAGRLFSGTPSSGGRTGCSAKYDIRQVTKTLGCSLRWVRM